MKKPPFRLRDDVRLGIRYEDETPFGSVVSGKIEERLRQACGDIVRHRERHGMADVVIRARALLEDAFSSELSQLFAGRGILRENCLFPARDAVYPGRLTVTRHDGSGSALDLPRAAFRELAPWLGDFSRGSVRPQAALGQALFDALESAGALDCGEREPTPITGDALFVGHASVLSTRGARWLFDPMLSPRSTAFPPSYQPLQALDLAPVDAIAITHSHPDHFDVGSLLRFPADTPIFVPEVARESLLAVDMAFRLEELGFSNVRRLTANARASLGGTSLIALPFFGEQPTVGEVLHPEVRNTGLIYVVDAPGLRILLLADAGRDRDGDTLTELAEARRELGEFRAIFGGYRAFAVYPIHYLFSSVARYLLFVPERDWTLRQKTMHDADDLIEAGERAGACEVVPYADGGAPWHWERGLGPRLDGSVTAHHAVDPPPEEVLQRAAERSSSLEGPIASPVAVRLLRPGQSLRFREQGVEVDFGPEQAWPYDHGSWLQCNVALSRASGDARTSARAVFRALAPELEAWRRDGRLGCFFFMRKPPDLRLRFQSRFALESALRPLLAALEAGRHIEHAYFSPYVPERERFGGTAALDAVHAWFDVDTSNWMLLEESRSVGTARLAPDTICAFVANDLVTCSVPGAAHGRFFRRLVDDCKAPTQEVALQGDDVPTAASEVEQAVLATYRQSNERLSEVLVQQSVRDLLSCTLTSALRSVIRFHWHRHGLDGASQAELAARLASRADSDRGELPSMPPQ